jgi:SET domain-containing protein
VLKRFTENTLPLSEIPLSALKIWIVMSEDVLVAKSRIHGLGVFALRDFKKGEVVFRWDISHEISKDDIAKIPDTEKPYVVHKKGKYFLLQPPERFLNHSCDANTHVVNFSDVCKRDIKKGEEITGDYSEDSVPDTRIKCNCGSKKCRKIISP